MYSGHFPETLPIFDFISIEKSPLFARVILEKCHFLVDFQLFNLFGSLGLNTVQSCFVFLYCFRTCFQQYQCFALICLQYDVNIFAILFIFHSFSRCMCTYSALHNGTDRMKNFRFFMETLIFFNFRLILTFLIIFDQNGNILREWDQCALQTCC